MYFTNLFIILFRLHDKDEIIRKNKGKKRGETETKDNLSMIITFNKHWLDCIKQLCLKRMLRGNSSWFTLPNL